MQSNKGRAACEISFIPIGISTYRTLVKQVLAIIEASGLEYQTGYLSTVVRGESTQVLALIADIFQKMDGNCDFTMDVKLSNLCGC